MDFGQHACDVCVLCTCVVPHYASHFILLVTFYLNLFTIQQAIFDGYIKLNGEWKSPEKLKQLGKKRGKMENLLSFQYVWATRWSTANFLCMNFFIFILVLWIKSDGDCWIIWMGHSYMNYAVYEWLYFKSIVLSHPETRNIFGKWKGARYEKWMRVCGMRMCG